MKNTFREFVIKLFTISGVTYLYNRLSKNKSPLVRVISFHDVPDDDWFGDLVEILKEKYQIISPTDLVEKKFVSYKINVLLTFDDGYDSWIKIVLPILNKFSLKGLFFINSGLLDVAEDQQATSDFMNKKLLVSTKQPLTWSGAKELIAVGHTIGGHSMNHCRLSELGPDELETEIGHDKKRIEGELDVELRHFAYPFGNDDDFKGNAREVVNLSGYTQIYTAKTGWYKQEDLEIPRTLLEKNQNVRSVMRWIEGGYDIFSYVNRLISLR